MVSVGLVKAADYEPITIVVKAGEKATITFQNEGNGFVAPDKPDKSYPVINGQTPTVKDASTAVYTVTAGKDQDLSLTVSTDYPTDVNKWKGVAITVDGKVKEFTIHKGNTYEIADGTCPLLSHITSITFTNNGETLEALKLGTNSWKTNYLPELGALTVPDNQLTYIPTKTDKMSTYSIGKVPYGGTTEYAGGGTNQTARSFLLLPSGLFASVHTYLKDIVKQSDLQIVALKDAEGNDITTYAAGEGNWDQAKAFYHFRNANKVYDKYGVFTADIKILSDSYPGVVLTGVKLNVQQAKFKLTIDNPDASKVAVSATSNGETINTNSELVCGQPFTLSAISQTGYQFAGFEVVEGATATDHEGDSYNFTVDGDNDITIKVKSEAASNKIVFEQDPAGTLEVLSDKGRLTTGSAITTGEELTIKVEAKEGFEIEQVTINNTPVKGTYSSEKNSFEGETTVPAVAKGEDVVIKVTYKAKAYRFTIVRPAADDNGPLANFTIKDKSKGQSIKLNEDGDAANVLAGTQLEIAVTLKDANIANNITAQINGEKQTFRKDGEGTYIIDYTMPSRSAKLVVDYAALKKITVQLDEDELAYDGTNQQVAYTTDPKNVQGITVEYANSADATEWSSTAYETIGTHYVRFTRKADANYQAMDGTSDYIKSYEIKGTQLVITDLPTVKVVEKDGATTYEITGGAVGYQRGDATYTMTADEMAKAGKFELVGTFNATAKSVKVKFSTNADNKVISSSDEANVALVDKDGNVAEIQVEINAKSAPGLVLMNGGAEVHSGDKLADGTKITFSVKDSYPTTSTTYYHEVYRVDDEGNEIKQADVWNNNQGYTINLDGNEKGRELLSFLLKTTDNRIQPVLDTNKSKLTQYVIYDGEAQIFDISADSLTWNNGKEGGAIENTENEKLYTTNDNGWWSITYKQGSTIVPEPINAGTYDVVLERKEGGTYKAIAPFTAKLVILPKKLTETEIGDAAPKASTIGAGSPLSDSELTGTPDYAGTYEWAESVASVDKTGSYRVKFVPADPNYAEVELKTTVTVEVNDKYTLNYSNPDGLGLIEVSDAYGIVPDGSTLRKGTKLYLTAVPKDATKVRLASISGVSIAAKDEGVIKSEFTFTGKMNIVANFSVIEPEIPDPEPEDPDEVIDPSSQYVVTVQKATTNNRGFILGKEGENGVYYTKPFEFTVNALDADLDKLVVTGATKVSKGKYRINSVTSNTTVTVSLPNPTPIDVKIVTESKNTKGYLVGKVKAEQYPLDGKCYYGDELVVVAYPVDGVSFAHWRDNTSNRDQMREITVTKAMTIEAVFSGVPTGIEDIESAGIYAGRGYIQVKNVSNADLTVVSISGRIQTRQHLEGDVQVHVPAGVYVVVLENGQDVKRVKVIVR